MTPSGPPTSWKIYAILRAVNDVFSAGFNTAVHPVARTGANLNEAIKIGKFHGVIYPQTPTGSNFVYPRNGPVIGI